MKKAKIYYARMDELWRKEQKLGYLEKVETIDDVDWQEIEPDKKYVWLTEGLRDDFDDFIAIGSKEAKSSAISDIQVVFKLYSRGVSSSRDDWIYSFLREILELNIRNLITNYNFEVIRYSQAEHRNIVNIDKFINNDASYIKWTDRLKDILKQLKKLDFDQNLIRNGAYRPFSKQFFYFDPLLCHRRYQQHLIFPTPETEEDNQAICLSGLGNIKGFQSLVSNLIPCLDILEKTQCFPFYIYDKDGTNRIENITDWALKEFRDHYQDATISKWDIFYYTYAVLHHPHYRTRYAANLKRELPRIPFAPEFHGFSIAGKRLAEIHINYEQQPEYRLKHIENKDMPIDWRVEKMRLSKDKTQIKYNDFLTLTGIPPEVFEYKLGNRSALDWIIDQYQVSTDKRSGIVNDPNRLDDEEYIVRLIKQVITVSLETVKIVKGLPDLGLPKD